MNGEKKELIRERLAEIEAANAGRLTPAAVLEDARDHDSPLHDQFEWDDGKAAHAHRLDQARAVITSVYVIQRTDKTTVRSVFYVRDPTAEHQEQGYVSTTTLRADSEMARAALVDEFSRVGNLLRRARQLAVVLQLDDEVEQLLNGVTELRNRVVSEAPRQTM